ncbi:Eukaryotic translation initiation factor 2D [Sparganum proliferum]
MLFDKPFKTRTSVLLRDSKKRKLIETIASTFKIDPMKAGIPFHGKSVHELKLSTSSRVDVLCYLADGVPFIFEVDFTLFPTVFFLTFLPSILKTFYTNESVLERIHHGAGLMLPGVYKEGLFAEDFAELCKGSACAVALISGPPGDLQVSKALAVGTLAMSTTDFQSSGGKGVFVNVLHTSRDRLAELCSPCQRAQFALTDTTPFSGDVAEHLPLQPDLPTEIDETETKDSDLTAGTDQTELLMECFLHGLSKLSASDLPLPVNVFYAKHMKNSTPSGAQLDIKKTAYQKVGVFLEKMAAEGYITIEVEKPGIITLTSVCQSHPRLEEFVLASAAQSETVAACSLTKSNFCVEDYYFGPPIVEEVRIISSPVAPFFAATGLGKGDAVKQAEIHQLASAYVDSKGLRNPDNKSIIKVDGLLMKVCDPNLFTEAPNSTLGQPLLQITYQDLVTSLTRGLKVAYRLTFPSESGLQPHLTAGNNRPKLILRETKVNGKDVTRISNLETFGIDTKSFSRHLRTILACSVNVFDDATNRNSSTVQAQGAHAVRLSKLLTEKFGLPEGWIEGYQKPKKSKKKGVR